jgi:hypothetical protein
VADRALVRRVRGAVVCGEKEEGLYVGLWVPSILALGSLLLANRKAP